MIACILFVIMYLPARMQSNSKMEGNNVKQCSCWLNVSGLLQNFFNHDSLNFMSLCHKCLQGVLVKHSISLAISFARYPSEIFLIKIYLWEIRFSQGRHAVVGLICFHSCWASGQHTVLDLFIIPFALSLLENRF